MMEKQFNPVIKAVQSLRKLSLDIKSTNKEIQSCDQEIRQKIEDCGKLIATTNDSMVINLWIREKAKLMENSDALLDVLKKIEQKFNDKDASGLLEIWETHESYKNFVLENFVTMERMGSAIFVGDKMEKWESAWSDIKNSLHKILSISETYHLKLKVMEILEPDEIDSLTEDILKHIPWNYSDEEAYQFEQEYLVAYKEIKESQSKKKNLWDKILNALAGGIEETPAHRVQMRRWMDGEGDSV
ncbi:hypothetical protein [Chryseobacterium pennipullorum]|uniref:Uncharacterized protein n=1 Tax=Chryseobacterium pennipullorum TaxID=2258963 RepID=A0A3D9AZK3_9FLAO|nr:hypothetical protein [Chryseobacterium pennipullorum]REC46467.1 hypothetical protein DRF67_14420 [Chryseobacterium pennipullorum]